MNTENETDYFKMNITTTDDDYSVLSCYGYGRINIRQPDGTIRSIFLRPDNHQQTSVMYSPDGLPAEEIKSLVEHLYCKVSGAIIAQLLNLSHGEVSLIIRELRAQTKNR